MSVDRLFPDGTNRSPLVDMRDIVEEWNKVFDEQHLKRDKFKHRMDWRTLFPITESKIHEIKGKRVFYNLVTKKYNYRIIQDADSNTLTVNVKIHFYPSKTYAKRAALGKEGYLKEDDLLKVVKQNLKLAQNKWNGQAPEGVRFSFDMVKKASQADYSIKLKTIFGALYDKFIMAPAYESVLSHEIGHMMGLDDEYSMITSNVLPVAELVEMTQPQNRDRHMDYTAYKDMRCNLESIMCLREKVYPYHLDHILGRIELD